MPRIRWGILGTASIAPSLFEGIRLSANSEATAVASRDRARARAWAEQHGVRHAFGSYDDLIDAKVVDAIYIPLPNSLHAEWTIRALEAGLPVLCEKPLTANAAEARRVLEARNRTGMPVAEAFMYRFHPMYDRLFEALRAGIIGDVVSVQSTFTFLLDEPDHVAASAALAGGALLDVGCYCVNLARRVAACEPTTAAAFKRGTSVDDTLIGMLEFPNGMFAQIECSIECFERVRAEIVGTQGSILIESPWNPGDERARFIVQRENSTERVETPGANRFQLEVEDLAAAILEGGQPRWPLEDAVANMAALDALIASARTGAAVPVEPVNA
ncbi:MAG TPA: Gfo/Idh/MocA family oxidoreductase [Candidatus Hydrogenedentes bacterium]|nr:Gfo/Idh/MocA family oxidoreductase [Candidatus Hydrogenedentota bacterium]HPG68426.1 Gfo/Idh/MocA family oxidoreductase [Candidatus Hydrogenedentota bacterium]